MKTAVKYESVASGVDPLNSVIPQRLVEETHAALQKLKAALGNDVSGYVANRLHMSISELGDALAAEQVDGVALAMYNIEKRAQSVIIGDQTGIGKGRQAAAMIRYGLLSGYLPVFFTDRYTLFSDMYRDCKALGIKEARPLVVNNGASVVDFDKIVENKDIDAPDEIWSPSDDEDNQIDEAELMSIYQNQYEVVYKSPTKRVLQQIFNSGDIPTDSYDYLMITYSQLKDARKDMTRLDFLQSLCEKHRVLFIFDEAHRSSSVSAGKISVITQGVNRILSETQQTQCVFLSATFAKRPESLITFMRKTALSALATENTLETALSCGGVPMQEYVSSSLAAEGQMIRREHSDEGIPAPTYTYLDDDLTLHAELFDKVMYFFREIVKLSTMVKDVIAAGQMAEHTVGLVKPYPTRAQLFYINKVLLLSLKAKRVAEAAIENVKQGRSVVIGMSDTLECILRDVEIKEDGSARGDFSTLLLRLLDKTVSSKESSLPIWELIEDDGSPETAPLIDMANELKTNYKFIKQSIKDEAFHLPMSPIDVIRQLITQETFITPDGTPSNIRFEECTGRAHQLEYLSPEGDDDYLQASIIPRKKRHSNMIFNDFQNNKLDVILINACGAIGASAHAISTSEVPDEEVRQRKMLIVQNDLDVNIDLQKRGRINRTGQRTDLPPLYEYIITAIPSEKRLNMMLRAKLRSLSANTAAYQDQDKEQADFIDISNKYGDGIANDYLDEHKELALVLGLSGRETASRLLARLAMLSVNAQQDVIEELIAAYTTREDELRRINQWDLERDFRDFEAEFVREELFTTAIAESRLGGCSYLTTYRCKQKTFPYPFDRLQELCNEAKENFGAAFKDNITLQKEIRKYYKNRNALVRQRFAERKSLLDADTRRILLNYCLTPEWVEEWLEEVKKPFDKWNQDVLADAIRHPKSKQILRKLTSYSNDYNHLLEREKKELKKYSAEAKRLMEILTMADIGSCYSNISAQIASEDCPDKVMAVLRDIRFGKDEHNRFQPSRVEFVFALTAVYTEIRINLVHNPRWSNYERLKEILTSKRCKACASAWNSEIAKNNNKIVERKIITGNILGAFAHPAISDMKPRFITFSLKNKNDRGERIILNGLLLPMDDSKVKDALQSVTIPLHEGLRYANSTSTSYVIAGLGINFSLTPIRLNEQLVRFVISVADKVSKDFEQDNRFDAIRDLFKATVVTSIYEKKDEGKRKRKPLMHYATGQLAFESESFQTIIQTLAQMQAVIIIPREQVTIGDMKVYASKSEQEENKAWQLLDWKDADAVPMPPVKESVLLRISAPEVAQEKKGKAVFRHSEVYLISQETMALSGEKLNNSTIDALRRMYMKWKYNVTAMTEQKDITYSEANFIGNTIRNIIERKAKLDRADFGDAEYILQRVLDSEHLDANGVVVSRFNEEMLFLAPEKETAQTFLDSVPCSPRLESMRKCLQDYIDGKTDIINSPDRF